MVGESGVAAAGLAAVDAWVRAQPLCGGYYGCAQSKTFAQQYADSSYAAARNAWSATAVNNYVTRSNYEFARMNWNDQTISNALSNYAAASLGYAKENWNERSIESAKERVRDYYELRWINERHAIEQEALVNERRELGVYNSAQFVQGFGMGLWNLAWEIGSIPADIVYTVGECFDGWTACHTRMGEQFDPIATLWDDYYEVNKSGYEALTGQKSWSEHSALSYDMTRTYTFGSIVDNWNAGDYYAAGEATGQLAGSAALLFTPAKAVPKLPKLPPSLKGPGAPKVSATAWAVYKTIAGKDATLDDLIRQAEANLLRIDDALDPTVAPQNPLMLERLREASSTGRLLTAAEEIFLMHEILEGALYKLIGTDRRPHTIASKSHAPYSNYDPAVIRFLEDQGNSPLGHRWTEYWDDIESR